MAKIITRSIFICSIILLSGSCKTGGDSFSISSYYQDNFADSLMVDIVTFIGRKPRLTDHITRHAPEHRKFYTEQAQSYRFKYFHVAQDSTHYYYIFRPARSPQGNLRGAGGKFRLDDRLRLYGFEEIFITPVLPEEELIEKGEKLFRELILNGNVERYIANRDYIEWPDNRLKYDKIRNEWRYDVITD